jgi:hypothetical protein
MNISKFHNKSLFQHDTLVRPILEAQITDQNEFPIFGASPVGG